MRPTERDLMVARAVRDACFVAADNIDGIDLAALIESLPEHDERPRCRCGWVSVEGGEIIDPFCPVHDVPVEHEQAARDVDGRCHATAANRGGCLRLGEWSGLVVKVQNVARAEGRAEGIKSERNRIAGLLPQFETLIRARAAQGEGE